MPWVPALTALLRATRRTRIASTRPSRVFGGGGGGGGQRGTGRRVGVQRIGLALSPPSWHNDHTGQRTRRSLTAYDH